MARIASIKIPEARGLQLRAIADARNSTVTAFIEEAINTEIANHQTIPDELPGFRVDEVETDKLNIAIYDFETGPIAPLAVEAFAAILMACYEKVEPSIYLRAEIVADPRVFFLGKHGEACVKLGSGKGAAIMSVGQGVAVKLVDAGAKELPTLVSMSRLMARDFTRQLLAVVWKIDTRRAAERFKEQIAEHKMTGVAA